jgi:hypothetical protein
VQTQQQYDMPNGSKAIGAVPRLGIAGGAALGGGTLVVLARRRARRKREEAKPLKKVEAVATSAAAMAKGTATTVGSEVRDGVDRLADDRRLRTYAIAGAAVTWLYLKIAEIRQLRRLSKVVEVSR